MSAQFGHDSLPDCEKMVECPYNKAHLVVQHRMANHMIKCRKNQGTSGTKECRFNSSHILPISDIKLHEDACPDRMVVEEFINHRLEKQQSSSSSASVYSSTKSESDWDDSFVPSYKPKRK